MKDTIITSEITEPYARALMSVAIDEDLTNQIGEDAALILETLAESEDLGKFLENPLIVPEAKKAALQQILGEQIHPYVQNFLMLLVDRGRIVFLPGVLRQYQILLREFRQTALAEVTSAIDLSDAQKDSIRQKVMSLTGAQQVDLEIVIDPAILGGLIIKVGSQIIDASLRGQLRRIGMQLGTAA